MRWWIANEARSAEVAIIISYPTSASGIIVLLITPTKYREFFPTLFVKTTYFPLVFNFEQTRTVTIFGEHGIIWLPKCSKIRKNLYPFNVSYMLEKKPLFVPFCALYL